MSLVEEVGAQVRAAVEELPVAGVTAAMARLRAGMDLLRWARQESLHEIGVDRAAIAAEHLENAARALLVAQEQLAVYLTAIGLTREGTPTAPTSSAGDRPAGPPPKQRKRDDGRPDPVELTDWWGTRVAVLTGAEKVPDAKGATDPDELLLRVAGRVHAGDRAGLAGELGSVKAHVGLALAALAPAQAYELTAQWLGRPPGPADLPRLTSTVRARVGALLPGMPGDVIDAQLARVCRAPSQPSPAPIHPADSSVAGAVLVAVLRQEAGLGAGERLRVERSSPERSSPERGSPERGSPERSSSERSSSERGGPGRAGNSRRPSDPQEPRVQP